MSKYRVPALKSTKQLSTVVESLSAARRSLEHGRDKLDKCSQEVHILHCFGLQ